MTNATNTPLTDWAWLQNRVGVSLARTAFLQAWSNWTNGLDKQRMKAQVEQALDREIGLDSNDRSKQIKPTDSTDIAILAIKHSPYRFSFVFVAPSNGMLIVAGFLHKWLDPDDDHRLIKEFNDLIQGPKNPSKLPPHLAHSLSEAKQRLEAGVPPKDLRLHKGNGPIASYVDPTRIMAKDGHPYSAPVSNTKETPDPVAEAGPAAVSQSEQRITLPALPPDAWTRINLSNYPVTEREVPQTSARRRAFYPNDGQKEAIQQLASQQHMGFEETNLALLRIGLVDWINTAPGRKSLPSPELGIRSGLRQATCKPDASVDAALLRAHDMLKWNKGKTESPQVEMGAFATMLVLKGLYSAVRNSELLKNTQQIEQILQGFADPNPTLGQDPQDPANATVFLDPIVFDAVEPSPVLAAAEPDPALASGTSKTLTTTGRSMAAVTPPILARLGITDDGTFAGAVQQLLTRQTELTQLAAAAAAAPALIEATKAKKTGVDAELVAARTTGEWPKVTAAAQGLAKLTQNLEALETTRSQGMQEPAYAARTALAALVMETRALEGAQTNANATQVVTDQLRGADGTEALVTTYQRAAESAEMTR